MPKLFYYIINVCIFTFQAEVGSSRDLQDEPEAMEEEKAATAMAQLNLTSGKKKKKRK
jgi:hypothetical protein